MSGRWRVVVAMGCGLALGSGAVWAEAPTLGPPDTAGVKVDLGDPMTAEGQARREAFGLGRRHAPSAIVLPTPTVPLRFSHARHLTTGLQCVDCHVAAATSVRARDVLLPREEGCLDCHDLGDPEASPPAHCATCHPGFEPRWPEGANRRDTRQVLVHPPAVVWPAPHLVFNHKVHLDRGVTCARCHGDMAKVDFATRENALPRMGSCLACHDGRQAPNACTTCHEALPDGRVRTELPGGTLRPAGWDFQDAHDDAWLRGHAASAAQPSASCAACHDAKTCLDCHSGVAKPLAVHPTGFELTHAQAARRDAPHCASCHRSQTFCLDCHQVTRVAPDAPETPAASVRFHPVGWVEGRGARGPNHHAFEAQRNVRACASCHTEASCISCHAPQTLGINPHPPGFSGAACERMRDRNARVCAKCHTPGARELQCR